MTAQAPVTTKTTQATQTAQAAEAAAEKRLEEVTTSLSHAETLLALMEPSMSSYPTDAINALEEQMDVWSAEKKQLEATLGYELRANDPFMPKTPSAQMAYRNEKIRKEKEMKDAQAQARDEHVVAAAKAALSAKAKKDGAAGKAQENVQKVAEATVEAVNEAKAGEHKGIAGTAYNATKTFAVSILAMVSNMVGYAARLLGYAFTMATDTLSVSIAMTTGTIASVIGGGTVGTIVVGAFAATGVFLGGIMLGAAVVKAASDGIDWLKRTFSKKEAVAATA